MSVLSVLLWLLVAVAVIFAAALVMPLAIRVQASVGEHVRWGLWLQPFGRFGPVIPVRGRRKKSASKPKPPTRKPGKRSWRKMRRVPSAGMRLMSDVLSIVHFRGLSLDLRFGCQDPADTGHLYGLMTPVLYGSSGIPKTELHVVPVFDRAEFNGEARLEMFFVPMSLVPPILRFGWSLMRPER